MSIVSDFGKKVSNKTKEISQKAKIISETNSLNNIIKGEQSRINVQYQAIGKLYFEKYGDNPDADFAEAISTIKASMEKIEETKKEVAKIRSRFNCPECGQAFKNDALFCSKCGAKLPEKEQPEKPLPKDAQKCDKCGNILPKDALFCNECGNSLASQENTSDEQITAVAVSTEEFAPAETQETVNETTVTETVTAEVMEEPKSSEEAPENTTNDVIVIETEVTKEVKTEESEQTEGKTCPNCNNKMDSDDLFCNECGTKVE